MGPWVLGTHGPWVRRSKGPTVLIDLSKSVVNVRWTYWTHGPMDLWTYGPLPPLDPWTFPPHLRHVRCLPPSTLIVSPVIHAASGDTRNAMRLAISSAVPGRPSGCVVFDFSRNAA